jgi:hypothetical protein
MITSEMRWKEVKRLEMGVAFLANVSINVHMSQKKSIYLSTDVKYEVIPEYIIYNKYKSRCLGFPKQDLQSFPPDPPVISGGRSNCQVDLPV